MGAITPDSARRISAGSKVLVAATFESTTIDDGDTWDTGIGNEATDVWANGTDDPTGAAKQGIDCNLTKGVVTFNAGEDDREAIIYILANI